MSLLARSAKSLYFSKNPSAEADRQDPMRIINMRMCSARARQYSELIMLTFSLNGIWAPLSVMLQRTMK